MPSQPPSEALTIGRQLVELCNCGENLKVIDTLYNPDILSIEEWSTPDMPARQQGLAAIRKKNQWWFENHTTHSAQYQGPYPHGDRFIVLMKHDVTAKIGPMAGKRMTFEEAGLYTVKNGKIVQEEFFYAM